MGKRILMTGCCTGVGKTIRESLVQWGHEVVGVGKNGPTVKWAFCFQDQSVNDERFIDDFMEEHGPFDVLINNAGTTHIDFLEDHSLDNFQNVLFVNLTMPFLLSKAFVKANKDRERNCRTDSPFRIINTTSMAAKWSMRASPGYCASKAGLEALTRQMARELSNRPYVVLGCGPGTIEKTEMSEQVIREMIRTRNMTEEAARTYAMQSPMGRACWHREVVAVYDFLVHSAPQYMSGETVYLPGGMGI